MTRITPTVERFCLNLMRGLKGPEAYQLAYKCNYKPATLATKACILAKEPLVVARMAELMAPVIAEVQITRKRWLQELVDCALFDARKMFDAHGNCLEVTELPDREAKCISSFEQFEEFEGKGESRKATGYTRRFKMVDKLKALELVGKACKFYEEDDPDGSKIPRSLTVTFVDKRSPYAPPSVTAEVVPVAPKVKFVPSR